VKPAQLDGINREICIIDIRVRQLQSRVAECLPKLISICNGDRVTDMNRQIDKVDLVTWPDGSGLVDLVEVAK